MNDFINHTISGLARSEFARGRSSALKQGFLKLHEDSPPRTVAPVQALHEAADLDTESVLAHQPRNLKHIEEICSRMMDIVQDPTELGIPGINRNSDLNLVAQHTSEALKLLAQEAADTLRAYRYGSLIDQIIELDDGNQVALTYDIYEELAKETIHQIIKRHDDMRKDLYTHALAPLIEATRYRLQYDL